MRSKRSSKRREDIWERWRAHLEAHRASGQTQAAYCQTHGLDPRHFSVWKGKLKGLERNGRKARAIRGATRPALRLVPLVIKKNIDSAAAADTDPMTIHLRLSNGLSVSMSISSIGRLPSVLEHLAQIPC